jgi:hypothetical protein
MVNACVDGIPLPSPVTAGQAAGTIVACRRLSVNRQQCDILAAGRIRQNMKQPTCTRRHMLKLMAAAPLLPSVASATPSARERRYHLCLASKEIARAPELLSIVKRAGVTDIWQGAFFYGHWYEDPEGLVKARKVVEDAGFHWHVINVPLGHPGDALGDQTGATPTAPPGAWKNARRPDGSW